MLETTVSRESGMDCLTTPALICKENGSTQCADLVLIIIYIFINDVDAICKVHSVCLCCGVCANKCLPSDRHCMWRVDK